MLKDKIILYGLIHRTNKLTRRLKIQHSLIRRNGYLKIVESANMRVHDIAVYTSFELVNYEQDL